MGQHLSKKKKKKTTEDVKHSKPYTKIQYREKSRSLDIERSILDKYDMKQQVIILKKIHWKTSCSFLLMSKVSQLQIPDICNSYLIEEKIKHIVPIKKLENDEFTEYLKIISECLINTLSMNETDVGIFLDKIRDYRRHRSNP